MFGLDISNFGRFRLRRVFFLFLDFAIIGGGCGRFADGDFGMTGIVVVFIL